jgi:hypothetical protein
MAGCGFSASHSGNASQCPVHHLVGFYYCDGFEDGLDSRYRTLSDNGSFALDHTKAYRGNGSLHFHVNSGAGDGIALGASVGAQSDFLNFDPNETHLRVFLFAAGAPVADSLRLVTVGGLEIYLIAGDLVVGTLMRSNTRMPLNRWICLELKLATGGGPWTGSLSVDGAAPLVMATQLGDGAGDFNLELEYQDPTLSPSQGLDLWFDELVVDHQAIGCD